MWMSDGGIEERCLTGLEKFLFFLEIKATRKGRCGWVCIIPFQGPPLIVALVMDFARLKIIKYCAIKITGTLVIISCVKKGVYLCYHISPNPVGLCRDSGMCHRPGIARVTIRPLHISRGPCSIIKSSLNKRERYIF
jgi:hypothetical protein